MKRILRINHPHIHFSQLFGMSDNITFNLARAGYSVSKYLPFGPIKDVIPYLMRRAQENSSVSGQTGRELALIKQEIARDMRETCSSKAYGSQFFISLPISCSIFLNFSFVGRAD